MKVHPIAELFPMMPDEELQALADDIKANGLLHAIILDDEKQIVDGRNRLAACKLAQVEPRFESLNGQDPRAVIVSANLARRNLTLGQRAMAYAFIYPDPTKLRRKGSSPSVTEGLTFERISVARKVRGFSEKLGLRVLREPAYSLDKALEEVEQAERRQTQEHAELDRLRKAAPDLADKVEEGKLKLEDANEKLSERLIQLRRIRDSGTEGVRHIQDYPAMVMVVEQAIQAGARELLDQELVRNAIGATKKLERLLQTQEEQ
jgi:hypothetical protein